MKPETRTTVGVASRAAVSRRLHATVHGDDVSLFPKPSLKDNYNVLSETETCCGSEEGLVRYIPRPSDANSSERSGSVKPSRPSSEESFYDVIEGHEFEREICTATATRAVASRDRVVEDVYSPYAYSRKPVSGGNMTSPRISSRSSTSRGAQLQWRDRSYAPASASARYSDMRFDETLHQDEDDVYTAEARAYAPALASFREKSDFPRTARLNSPTVSRLNSSSSKRSLTPLKKGVPSLPRSWRDGEKVPPPMDRASSGIAEKREASSAAPPPRILHRYASMPVLTAADEDRVEEFRRNLRAPERPEERKSVANGEEQSVSATSSPRFVGEVCSVEYTGDPLPTFHSWGRVVLKKRQDRLSMVEPRLEAEDVQELIDRFGPQSFWGCLWAPWNCWGFWKSH